MTNVPRERPDVQRGVIALGAMPTVIRGAPPGPCSIWGVARTATRAGRN